MKRTVPADSNNLISRRHFVIASVVIGGGFALGIPALAGAVPASKSGPFSAGDAIEKGAIPLTDWIRITRDNVVTLVVSQTEMGQGISTTLPVVLADELGADWSAVRLELAPTALPYRNPRTQWQFTGNSESTQSFYEYLRKIGATARAMLTTAAAEYWKVNGEDLVVENSVVRHAPSGRSATFGELAEAAAQQPVPQNAPLRPDQDMPHLGKSVPRVDQVAKANGSAEFGIDYLPEHLKGVVFAAIRTAPAFDGKPLAIKNMDIIKRLKGVIDVLILPTAVAVVAEKYWQARAAMNRADIEFDRGSMPALDSAQLRQQYLSAMQSEKFVVVKEDGAQPEIEQGKVYEATYELGFQSHATLEPMNALAAVTATSVDIWAPTQGQELTKYAVAGALNRDPATVNVYRSPFVGGGFGRRLLPDFVLDAVFISSRINRPVKVIWSREEDMRRSVYRPATLHRLTAVQSKDGTISAIRQRLVSPTILKPVYPPLDLTAGVDPSAVEGMLHTRYEFHGWRSEFHLLTLPVPTSVYRTTGYGPTLFGIESFIDELAHSKSLDPLSFRRELLTHDSRALRVIDELAARSQWKTPLAKNHGRGMAFAEAFGTLIAQAIDIQVVGKKIKLTRVVTVADPGRVLDPKITEAGLEGGTLFGLTAATKNERTFRDGAPVETNFHQYDMVRLRETPRFETFLLETPGAPLGGVGEVAPVVTAPALANAIFSATGQRLRELPLSRSGFALL